MNPNDATNEELRDWLAIKQGWQKRPHETMCWVLPRDGESPYKDCIHPIPNTIDAAAECLPEGWKLLIHELTMKAYRGSWATFVTVDRTSDEATDRFRLAVKAIMAMEGGK